MNLDTCTACEIRFEWFLPSVWMMTDLEALLAGIVSEPLEETRWLVLADWLDENDDVRRGEFLRLHRKLLSTCCEPDAHPERAAWQARIVELIAAGVRPCVPQRVVQLPGPYVLMPFSFIPPGSFLMGGNVDEDEMPIHAVTLTNGFFMGVHLVTQAQWKSVMGNDPSHFKGPNRPVEMVSWSDCQEFCQKLSSDLKGQVTVRLPRECEWERACRSGTTTHYHFSDVLNTDLANYNGEYTWNDSPKGKNRQETTDVGSFPANAWGLYDVHGNVWEWCEDWFGAYPAGDQTATKGQSDGRNRVLRGGSYDYNPVECRAAYRHWSPLTNRRKGIGFRVCFRLD